MPLAVTQADFLVNVYICSWSCRLLIWMLELSNGKRGHAYLYIFVLFQLKTISYVNKECLSVACVLSACEQGRSAYRPVMNVS